MNKAIPSLSCLLLASAPLAAQPSAMLGKKARFSLQELAGWGTVDADRDYVRIFMCDPVERRLMITLAMERNTPGSLMVGGVLIQGDTFCSMGLKRDAFQNLDKGFWSTFSKGAPAILLGSEGRLKLFDCFRDALESAIEKATDERKKSLGLATLAYLEESPEVLNVRPARAEKGQGGAAPAHLLPFPRPHAAFHRSEALGLPDLGEVGSVGVGENFLRIRMQDPGGMRSITVSVGLLREGERDPMGYLLEIILIQDGKLAGFTSRLLSNGHFPADLSRFLRPMVQEPWAKETAEGFLEALAQVAADGQRKQSKRDLASQVLQLIGNLVEEPRGRDAPALSSQSRPSAGVSPEPAEVPGNGPAAKPSRKTLKHMRPVVTGEFDPSALQAKATAPTADRDGARPASKEQEARVRFSFPPPYRILAVHMGETRLKEDGEGHWLAFPAADQPGRPLDAFLGALTAKDPQKLHLMAASLSERLDQDTEEPWMMVVPREQLLEAWIKLEILKSTLEEWNQRASR